MTLIHHDYMNETTSKIKIFSLLLFLLLFAFLSKGVSATEEKFFVDPFYDLEGREEIASKLIETSDLLYFYIDKEWWEDASSNRREKVEKSIEELGKEFDDNIYPTLTSEYGPEWKPGIDNDNKITVLIHPMRGTATGYFNSGDEYSVYQNASSNEREMVYLDAGHITADMAASYLSHEMTHLITFNQKERLNNIQEEVWLNEARAEYAPTLCGYNDEYEGSYLRSRVVDFLNYPSDSITEWQGEAADYGALSLFIHYLVDHYGKEILADSLKSSKVGIESINEALGDNAFDKRFSDIFVDWTVAILVNDCSLGEKYCYLNRNLDNLKIVPKSNFLPIYASYSTLSIYRDTERWAGNWHKIFGGKGTLTFNFNGEDSGDFNLPYVTCSDEEECSVDFLFLNEQQEGEIIIENFNKDYLSLFVIPSVSNGSGSESNFSFSWNAETDVEENENSQEEQGTNQEKDNNREESTKDYSLDELLALLSEIKQRIAQIVDEEPSDILCRRFNNNLYYGLRSNGEVECLQQFLRDEGSDVYPEGLVTGNYLSLTRAAVIRFQEKYKDQILIPLGLEKGTGYFGPRTRSKVNSML